MNISTDLRALICAVILAAVPVASANAGYGSGQCLGPIDPGPDDEFGQVLVTGDFNGDRSEDLAVHAGYRAGFEGAADSGTVTIYLRQANGALLFDREFSYPQQGFARFGAALAAGRFAVLDEADPQFDRDALVIGIPGLDSEGGLNDTGRVHILLRSNDGVWFQKRMYDQASPGVPGALEAGDAFGSALAVGYFDDDDNADLAIGSPGEAVGDLAGAGSVTVLYGEDTGIDTLRTLLVHQDSVGVATTAEAGDRFGASLASGDFLKDGYDDLVIGVPGEDLFNDVMRFDAGLVQVLPGSAAGLVVAIGTSASAADFPPLDIADGLRFGEALVMGRFRDDDGGLAPPRDSGGDLAIGVPGFSSPTRDQIGLVVVAYRSPDALFDPGQPRQTILASEVGEPGNALDRFGASLAAGPLTSLPGKVDTLAIGAPYRDFGLGGDAVSNAGAVYLIEADRELGLQPAQGRTIQPLDVAPCGAAAPGAHFGRSLAILNKTDALPASLAIGLPGLPRLAPDAGRQGGVELRSRFGIFRDGFDD